MAGRVTGDSEGRPGPCRPGTGDREEAEMVGWEELRQEEYTQPWAHLLSFRSEGIKECFPKGGFQSATQTLSRTHPDTGGRGKGVPQGQEERGLASSLELGEHQW